MWTVSALAQAFSDALNARFNSLTVRGEVSGLVRAASGHQYFNLKDGTAQLRCVWFRIVLARVPCSDKIACAKISSTKQVRQKSFVISLLTP